MSIKGGKAAVKKPAAKSKKPVGEPENKGAALPWEDGELDVDYEGIANEFNNRRGGNRNFWTMEDDKAKIRPIPYLPKGAKKAKLFVTERRHFKLHPKYKVLPCLGGSSCPICALADRADKDDRRLYLPSEKFLCNIVDRNDPEQRIQVARLSFGVFNGIMEVVNDREEYPDSLSIGNGIDFILTRTGSGKATRYNAKPAPKRSSVSPVGVFQDLDKMAEFNLNNMDLDQIAEEIAEANGLD